MRIPEKVLSQEELTATCEEVVYIIDQNDVCLASGLTLDCPDRGMGQYFLPERAKSHIKTCLVCQERRRLHNLSVTKIMN